MIVYYIYKFYNLKKEKKTRIAILATCAMIKINFAAQLKHFVIS